VCLVWEPSEMGWFYAIFWVRLTPSHVRLKVWGYLSFFGLKENGRGFRTLTCEPNMSSFFSSFFLGLRRCRIAQSAPAAARPHRDATSAHVAA
jgi:hypothetical protein